MSQRQTWANWRAEASGALNATAAMLPFVLSYGLIVYGGLGDAAGRIGLQASVVAVVIGGVAMLLLGRSPLPSASPSASACLILGGAVLVLMRDPALTVSTPQGTALLLAATAAIVALSGLGMILLGLLKAGSLVRFVPQPVLAGFMNGVAVLIVVSQLPPLLGVPAGAWAAEGVRSLADWRVPDLVVALCTAGLMALIAWRWPRLPAPLVALVVAGAAVALWGAFAPAGAFGADLPRLGALEATVPLPYALAPLLDTSTAQALWPHARTIALNATLLALIGALESVLAIAAVDQQTQSRSDPNRELVALGGANLVSAAFGGLPLVYMRLRALATLSGGGRSARSLWLGCATMALLFTLGLALLQPLATAVIAGVVVMLAWTLVDGWTRQMARQWWAGERSRDLLWSLAVVALVCAVTLGWGFVAGVAAGVLAAMVIFIRALQHNLVRARCTAADFPSRRVYAVRDEALLAPLRSRIQVLELEGALFFGNAERLLQAAEQVLEPAAGETASDLIVDLRRVSTIDASGAVAVARLARQAATKGVALRLAGARPDDRHGRALAAHGVRLAATAEAAPSLASTLAAYPDLDHALEASESEALERVSPSFTLRSIPLAHCQLAAGLDAEQTKRLNQLLKERHLVPGQLLFAQGDTGDAMYLLTFGSVSMVDASSGQRFVSFSPGMCFGETAVLDGGGRTANAVADSACRVLELPAAALSQLQRDEPALAAQVYRNLATHVSERLRSAAAGWRRAAG